MNVYESFRLFKSIQLINKDAKAYMGWSMVNGYGTNTNPAKGYEYLKYSIEGMINKSKVGYYYMGKAYFNGHYGYIDINRDLSKQYLKRAIQKGYKRAESLYSQYFE